MSGKADAASEAKKNSTVLSVVAFYFVVSISLVLLNKVMFSSKTLGIDAPLFLTWTQIVVAVLACLVVHALKPSYRALDFFPFFEYRTDIALKIAPLTVIFLGMIVFNNLCLKHVDVSFYQVARALSLVFNVIFTYVVLGKSTSRNAIASCGVVVLGYYLGVEGELNFSFLGVVYGLLSSLFVALYSIYVKKYLPILNDNEWLLLIYNNVNALIMMPPVFFFIGEVPVVIDSPVTYVSTFWVMILIVGFFGFLINIATFMQIKYTSPLTHNVSGTAKACVQTLLGVMIWQNAVSATGIFGTLLSIFGCAIYSYIRYLEMQKPAAPTPAPVAMDKAPASLAPEADLEKGNSEVQLTNRQK